MLPLAFPPSLPCFPAPRVPSVVQAPAHSTYSNFSGRASAFLSQGATVTAPPTPLRETDCPGHEHFASRLRATDSRRGESRGTAHLQQHPHVGRFLGAPWVSGKPLLPTLLLCGTGQTSSFWVHGATQALPALCWMGAAGGAAPAALRAPSSPGQSGGWGLGVDDKHPRPVLARGSFPGAGPEDSAMGCCVPARSCWRVPMSPSSPHRVVVRCPSRGRCPCVAIPMATRCRGANAG